MAISPAATGRLNAYRIINAIVGIPGGILALFLTLGSAYYAWSRYGNDPEVTDSPSVLMAGPPAGMTPSLATVLRDGSATQHSINTMLVDLGGRGLLSFRNLDRVKKVKREDDPDPLVDPAIEVVPPRETHSRQLPPAEREAYGIVNGLAIGDVLTREPLWRLNDEMGDVKTRLEDEAVRLGWLTQRPTPLIHRWVAIGIAELVAAAGLVWLGYSIPMSGLTLVGAATSVGGIGTAAFGSAMSKRTPQGAYVDAMLKAYRRTLQKTLELARNMGEVVEQPEVRTLADTPDKAVVWGFALGLHRQVATVLERGLADARTPAAAQTAYYPAWLGSSSIIRQRRIGLGRRDGRPVLRLRNARTSAACSAPSAAWGRRRLRSRVEDSAGAAARVVAGAAAPSDPPRSGGGGADGLSLGRCPTNDETARPGGRPGGGRPDRAPRDRGGFGSDRPQRPGGFSGDRPQRPGGFSGDRPQRPGGFSGDRPQRPGGFRPRDDEGGMSIRLDPRRLAALKLLAAEAGVRPGELVTSWVEERLDAARAGKPVAAAGVTAAQFAELAARVDRLASRLDSVDRAAGEAAGVQQASAAPVDAAPVAAPRRRGRPPKTGSAKHAPRSETPTAPGRVPLHEEIAEVIRERGPLAAGEIAAAIVERGRYAAPRSSRPLDAATVNSRVSNPAYRSRFVRSEGRIGLA